ncbi:hypothetical protein [Tumebacillus avium]|nr:hypothetical protein [Tumebacillus avium]
MMKRLVLSGLILTCALTFTGCSEQDHDHAATPATQAQHNHN